jgi:3-isopropylmalate/(R)-2-methylmalate dehydratase large subunit
VTSLPVADRWLFPLIVVDVGAKSGSVEPDDVTRAFLGELGLDDGALPPAEGDGGGALWEYDVDGLEPQVACPPTVGNVKPVGEVAGTPVQWVELGGHGGGRLEDFAAAAELLRGRRVHPDLRLNLVPSSRAVFARAARTGLVEALHAAGGTWFPPSTGSNQAVNMGAMAAGERMLSTHSRNFPGRNGSAQAEMYLASAATAAATAALGRIADPRELA